MNASPTRLPSAQCAVLRLVLRLDRKGLSAVSNADLQRAFKTTWIYTPTLSALAKKGLVVRLGKGWVSTWAARCLATEAPEAIGLSGGLEIVLPLPGLLEELPTLTSVRQRDFIPPPPFFATG